MHTTLLEDFVVASNSDNRIEAFYIDTETSTVMHTWQLEPGNPASWSSPEPLHGTNSSGGGSNTSLTGAHRVEATTDTDGQIHVVTSTSDNTYYVCYQTPGAWNGWFEIKQK